MTMLTGFQFRMKSKAKAGRILTISAVHTALQRLEKKGLLKSWVGGETRERGGRRKRFFQLTGNGKENSSRS